MQSLARRRREGVGERPSHPPQPGHAKGHQVARIGGSLARTPAAHPSVRHTRQRAPHRRRASQHPLARRPQCRGSAGSSCNHARGPSRARRAGAHTGPWRARRPVTSENIVCVPRGQRARQVGWRRRCLYSNGSPRWGVQFNQIVVELTCRGEVVFWQISDDDRSNTPFCYAYERHHQGGGRGCATGGCGNKTRKLF